MLVIMLADKSEVMITQALLTNQIQLYDIAFNIQLLKKLLHLKNTRTQTNNVNVLFAELKKLAK